MGPSSLLSNGYLGKSGREEKLTTHPHLVAKPRMVELYLHFPIYLHGVMINYPIKHRDNFTFVH
jgi:hypothetical protein